MILSTSEIKENIKDISNKNNKISREIKSNKLIKLKKDYTKPIKIHQTTYLQEVYTDHHIFRLTMH